MLQQKITRTISITSGKGGVGKTTLTCNLALTLAQGGRKVLIFDGDLGMANVDILFGVKSRGSLHEVVKGEKTVQEILTEVYPNIYLISGGSGVTDYNTMTSLEKKVLVDSMSQLHMRFDYVLVDTAPGIADHVLYLNSASDDINVVLTPDPSSMADSYALIKILHKNFKRNQFSIICNQVKDEEEGRQLFIRFQEVCDKFLMIRLDFKGAIPFDTTVKRSNQNQKLFMRQETATASTRALKALSVQLSLESSRTETHHGLQMFVEQVVGTA